MICCWKFWSKSLRHQYCLKKKVFSAHTASYVLIMSSWHYVKLYLMKHSSAFFAHEHVIPEEQCVFNFCNNQMFEVCQYVCAFGILVRRCEIWMTVCISIKVFFPLHPLLSPWWCRTSTFQLYNDHLSVQRKISSYSAVQVGLSWMEMSILNNVHFIWNQSLISYLVRFCSFLYCLINLI